MLSKVADNIWVAFHPQKLMGAHFGTRMTVVRLGSRLWLHSAIPIDDALATQLAGLGEVGWIVAPNLFHHMHVEAARARYPAADVLAAEGLVKKRASLADATVLQTSTASAWNDLEAVHLAGMPKLNETVFFHVPSQTLVAADICFNLVRPKGLWSRLLFGMFGASGSVKQSRYFRSMVADKAALAASIRQVLEWPFQRIIIAHGEIVDSEARDKLAAACAWLS